MKHFSSKTNQSKGNPAQKQPENFFQAKLNVGQPGDKFEMEADQMADQVVSGIHETDTTNAPSPETTVQTQQEEELATAENTETEVQEKSLAESVTPVVQPQMEEEQVQEKEEEEELQMQDDEELQKSPSASDDDDPNEGNIQAQSEHSKAVSPQLESQIKSGSGGSPMDPNTQSSMESGFGADFSGVNIHTDSSAVQMSSDLGAQAFTHGNDIYFNEGKYNPSSPSGQHLLAHELTHTIQQGSSNAVQGKMVQKEGEEDAPQQDPNEILKTFYLPSVKARHLQVYQAWASQRNLVRKHNYSRDTNANDKPQQVRNWKNHYWDKLENIENIGLHEDFTGVKKIGIPGDREISGRRRTLLKKLTIPDWSKNGVVQEGKDRYEVDHIVELQVSGWAEDQRGNDFPNLELLDGRSNASAGSKTRSNVENIVRDYLEANGEGNTQADAQRYMSSNDIVFERVEMGSGDYAGESRPSEYWTREEITQGVHLSDLEDLGNIGEPGTPTEFALMTPDDGYLMQLFPHEENNLNISIPADSTVAKSVAGLTLSQINLSAGFDSLENDTNIGTATVAWDLPDKFSAPPGTFTINLKKSESQYAGKLGNLPELGSDFEHLSPISFSGLEVTDEGLIAEGVLTPSLSFLQDAAIRVGIRGKEIYFSAEYSPSNITLPIPRLNVNSATLAVGYSTLQGFEVSGDAELEMQGIATGNITAGFSEAEGLYLRGEINFDEQLFGETQASARIAYENESWTVGGTITIPRNKVRGVKSATINATYSENTFSATGEAELDIPGIERGSMSIEYGDEGFSIGGDFDLSSDIPGISGGNVAVRVSKESGAEEYDVFVSGTAQPDIPGISSELSVTYENGALTIEGRASYERGMLSGTIEVGATNRAIGEDGEPTGEPDDTMRVYGGGSLTLQLTPWLEATAGVTFTPEGEIEVTARLAADSYEVFSRREVNRNLFTVPTIEIPLFAIPLGPRSIGLVAQIGGGLDFTAGFGPGELRNMSAEITYNPEREEETTVAGHGEFAIPADAGLTLRGDLSLGVSVGIASLTGGIELAGSLGLEGEAAAEVDVNWSPQTGLALDAEGRVTVNPKFTFDLNAFARASLGIGWFSISETWRHNLASYEWGPDIQFGVVFPVHYREGEAFDMSFDDIEVIYPDLDVIDMAKGLARDVKNDIFS
ncbi:hypothetical protein DN752_00020 [Echinicola strongylocentroti]|uniref:eCIS core domain-containing protein n=1 Tax=Echinicola strongylocentroti TaxID=1795355 RepID=A0A2Z4IDY0_9BACT|nr:DUF4157 domain-containing protein [Echinicola strongylocentroti]AWW28653.1 hypothetical protein DN752_00020 [Echinicola strongylocentroti]